MIEIVCVDDQREVLTALRNDIEVLAPAFGISECESALEAEDLLNEFDADGNPVGLIICDQVMPQKSGVQLLSDLTTDGRFGAIRKLMLTGLATQQDTIDAINHGGIHAYIQKPWEPEQLLTVVRQQLTHFVVQSGLEYENLMAHLDQPLLYEELRRRV